MLTVPRADELDLTFVDFTEGAFSKLPPPSLNVLESVDSESLSAPDKLCHQRTSNGMISNSGAVIRSVVPVKGATVCKGFPAGSPEGRMF